VDGLREDRSMSSTDIFIPNGDSRTDTAVLLVGTAEEYGIDQSTIRATNGGFWINEALADLIYEDEVVPEDEPVATKTSSNRAAKNDSKEESSGN
jgi:hypothetical protein